MLEKKQQLYNSDHCFKITEGDWTEERSREGGCKLTFMDFSKAEGEKVKKKTKGKKTCAHSVILTPLSLPDLRVIEVWCVILMNKNHSDTFLVKNERR